MGRSPCGAVSRACYGAATMREGMRRGPVIAAVVMSLLAILGGSCGPAPATSSALDAPPARGGTVVLAIWQEPTTLLPQFSGMTATFLISNLLIEGLTQTASDGTYVPVLAQRVPTIANGGVKLSADGKRMD